ncbi:unnamed protein product [marine sediment metagenome]|uniref:Uncharacterized protein n=1 Tax=marine sediment metagenome TaxID=412755 RepID=X1VSD5_9ZZZZ
MALPKERLDRIKEDLEAADKSIKSIEEVIEDLRASGIDASKQEEKLATAKGYYRQTKMFYDLEMKRLEGSE